MTQIMHSDVFTRRRTQRISVFILLAVLAVLAGLISIVLGQYYISLSDLFPILAFGPSQESLTASVVWSIRLPRLVLGLLVGAALGVAGTLMQAIFANPLAEPSIIGVTSGAGVGAAVAIVFNLTFAGTFTAPALAFLSALLVTFIIYQLARHNGRVTVVNLILTGIAINAVCNAIISFMVYLAPTANREAIIFWQMGSFNGSQWKHVWVVLPVVLVGLAVALCLGRQLDILALGERAAAHWSRCAYVAHSGNCDIRSAYRSGCLLRWSHRLCRAHRSPFVAQHRGTAKPYPYSCIRPRRRGAHRLCGCGSTNLDSLCRPPNRYFYRSRWWTDLLCLVAAHDAKGGALMLSVDNLTVHVDGHTLVDSVTFKAQPGEVTGLIGPNGAGKSTVLGAVAGDIDFSGEIRIGGLSPKAPPVSLHVNVR